MFQIRVQKYCKIERILLIFLYYKLRHYKLRHYKLRHYKLRHYKLRHYKLRHYKLRHYKLRQLNIMNTISPLKSISCNKLNLQLWLQKGNIIPICINIGCNKQVSIRHWSVQGIPSIKTECSKCYNARTKHKTIKGVYFHKKNYCENKDAILGFVCPMDQTRYNEFPSDIYHMDHFDGNHYNNTLSNLITLCAICHTRKSKENGDCNGYKLSRRICKV